MAVRKELKEVYENLLSTKDEARYAEAFNNVYPCLEPDEKAWCDRALKNAISVDEIGPIGARALAVAVLLFYHMHVDDQDLKRAHGERVQTQWERVFAGKLRSQIELELKELV